MSIGKEACRGHVVALVVASLIALAAPLHATAQAPDSAAASNGTAQHAPITEHVVLISIDGLRPDAIREFEAETLLELMETGRYTLDAQTILPSKTLPSHTSMLTGVPPSVHGVTWNQDRTDEAGVVEVPTVFEIASDAGHETAAFFSKAKFHHLERPGSLDHVQAPWGNLNHWMVTRTVSDVTSYLTHERPGLLFVHIGEADYAGHAFGWMGTAYGWAVQRADAAVRLIVQSAEEAFGTGEFTVIVTADHGGHGKTHGSDDPRDMTIPWIVWGEGVSAKEGGTDGGEITTAVRTMDTAATALWLLGVDVPADWTGEPVVSAFNAPVTAAATPRSEPAVSSATPASGRRAPSAP